MYCVLLVLPFVSNFTSQCNDKISPSKDYLHYFYILTKYKSYKVGGQSRKSTVLIANINGIRFSITTLQNSVLLT